MNARIYDSELWIKDIDAVIATLPSLKQLSGKSILITGAAGLICSAVTDIIIRYNETHDDNIHIVAAGRWLEEMTNRFGEYCNRHYFTYAYYDASKNNQTIPVKTDYVIHGASNAYPDLIMQEPVETMLSNFTGLYELLKYAKDNGTKRVLYISSSEVYGNKNNGDPFKEDEYGFIDILNPRNSYSVGKRAAETLCASFSSEYGMDTIIVRPGHIYGPTASPNDSRVSSAFSFAAARGLPIVLKSDGKQIRSYCYCLDCASAILTVLLHGENCNSYNISNKDSIISILEMAKILSCAGNTELVITEASETEIKGFNPMINSSLESEKLSNLGWKGLFNANVGFNHTVEILKTINK